jgi:hypothetical protein
VPAAGRVISENGARPSRASLREEDGILVLEQVDDVTPGWLYWSAFITSVMGFFWAFIFWASGAEPITPVWRAIFLGLMVVFAMTAFVVATRLTRREQYHVRARQAARRAAHATVHGSRAYVRRRREGMVRMVHEARAGVVGAGKSLRESGTQFREGFQSDQKPNFIIRTVHGFVRAGVWVYVKVERLVMGVLKLVLGIFRLVLWIYVKIVQLVWAIYRGLLEPIVLLAFRLTRWVVGVAYRAARWTLRTAWRIFYWLVRRWPMRYATRLLEVPMRVHVAPAFLSTDVLVSGALGVPVRPAVLEAAGPSVEALRLRHRMRTAARLIPLYEQREVERPERVALPRPQDRQAMRVERARRRKAERERRLHEKAEAARAEKEAKLREQERKAERSAATKAAQAEIKERLRQEKAAGRKLSKEDRRALEWEIRRRHLGEEAGEAPTAVAAAPAKGDRKAERDVEKQEAQSEKARLKGEKARAKEERKRAREEEKREREAIKEAEKESGPILKARVKAAKKEGRKLGKDEQATLRQEIVDGLVAAKLGRPVPAAPAHPAAASSAPAGPQEGPVEEAASAESKKKERRGFSLKRRGKDGEAADAEAAVGETGSSVGP